MEKSKKRYWKIAGISVVYGALFFVVFGIITVLIPNKFFARMTPITMLDYIFLILTSLLLGTYIGLHRYQKKYGNKKCGVAAVGGGVGGFLSFGCSVCNKILVLVSDY